MDLAGGTFAARRAKGRVATASIDAMRFLRPIAGGKRVKRYSTLQDNGETSFGLKIGVWVHDRTGGTPEKVTEGAFTCVALDDDGKPRHRSDADARNP